MIQFEINRSEIKLKIKNKNNISSLSLYREKNVILEDQFNTIIIE